MERGRFSRGNTHMWSEPRERWFPSGTFCYTGIVVTAGPESAQIVCVCACTHEQVHVYLCVHMHVQVHVYLRAHTNMHSYTRVCTHR